MYAQKTITLCLLILGLAACSDRTNRSPLVTPSETTSLNDVSNNPSDTGDFVNDDFSRREVTGTRKKISPTTTPASPISPTPEGSPAP